MLTQDRRKLSELEKAGYLVSPKDSKLRFLRQEGRIRLYGKLNEDIYVMLYDGLEREQVLEIVGVGK